MLQKRHEHKLHYYVNSYIVKQIPPVRSVYYGLTIKLQDPCNFLRVPQLLFATKY